MGVDQTFEDTWTLPGNNGIDGRYHDGAFLAMASGSVNPLGAYRDGVLPSAYSVDYLDLKVIPDSPTPGMAVRCYLGQSVITRSGQGPYVSTLRSTGRVDLDASSTTNPRRDLIVVQVLDASIGDADTRTRLWRITGTPSGTPTLPTVPLGAIPTAEVAVAANATSITNANITDLRRAAGIRGAVRLMLPGDSHSDAGIYPGDSRYCRTHQQVEVWKADGVWHGTVPLVYTVSPAHAALPVPSTFATLAIPDPGWPYKLVVNGKIQLNDIGASGNAGYVKVRTGTALTGPTVGAAWAGKGTSSVANTNPFVAFHAADPAGTARTGATNVYGSLETPTSGNVGVFASAANEFTTMTATVIPV
ncbi:hypothetical protein ACWEFJ_28465 [Actinosynnema sp. NPDC004786]